MGKNNKKHTIEYINNEFKKEGYTLLSKKYINAHKKLNYVCNEGHHNSMNWNKFQSGRRCPTCANLFKRGRCFRLDYMDVRQSFINENYTLLTKFYRNAKQKLNYVCDKGHNSSISWDSWSAGHRCMRCSGIRQSVRQVGSSNPFWKGGISLETYCSIWRDAEYKDSIRERDNNKCLNPVCLGRSNRLAIHHVNYNKKDCELKNLITLCNSCNGAANKDRNWHKAWYQAILNKRYNYKY